MAGLSRHKGDFISPLDHLRQSIEDILTTPVGTRVMRRDYGSRLFELVDRPMTPALKVDIYAATVEALRKWEPRFVLERVFVTAVSAGHFTLGVTGRDNLGNGLEVEEVRI